MKRMQDTLERVLSLSKADDCIAIGYESASANIRWANSTTTTNGVTEDNQLIIISIVDGRVGVVARNYFPDDRLEEFVRASETACKGKPPAEDAMPLVAGHGTDAEWSREFEPTGIDVFSSFAPDLSHQFQRAQMEGLALFGYAEHSASCVRLATSAGIRKAHTHQEGRLEINAKTPDFSRSAWEGRFTADFADVDLSSHYETLQQRIQWSKNQIDLPAGRYEVILQPSAAADMLLYMLWSSSAREADEGRSVFSKPGGGNRTGEKLFADGVSLYSDPSERGLEVAPFAVTAASSSFASVFDNGEGRAHTDWVRDGVLRRLITTRHWADKTGTETTPFIENLIFPSDGPTLEEMIANTTRALLVTCFWYIREVDPQTLLLTGLTRDGVFLVENGEVVGAVNNYRYNMSPIDMLAQTIEIGRTEPTLAREFGDYFTFAKVPPLRVRDFNMSSVSQAT